MRPLREVRASRPWLVVAVMLHAAGCQSDGAGCPPPQTGCDGACVSLETDQRNCGACGVRCGLLERCVVGACESICNTDAGMLACGVECVDSQNDDRHCGGCFAECAFGASCIEGHCASCGDLSVDSANCGVCGLSCVPGSECRDGRCTCAAGDLCDEQCVDTTTDEAHCGGCHLRCSELASCVDGVCVCPSGFLPCGGCLDADSTAAHCGACGVATPGDALCDGGRVVCQHGSIDCNGWPDRIDCWPSTAEDDCSACAGGRGCSDGSTCAAGGCAIGVLSLVLDCGGPHVAGARAVPCSAALRLAIGTALDVSTSPFLRWSVGPCTGPTCGPPRDSDAPHLGEGGALWPGAGTFVPAGSEHPERVTEVVTLEVRGRFQLGTTDVEAVSSVRTVPGP